MDEAHAVLEPEYLVGEAVRLPPVKVGEHLLNQGLVLVGPLGLGLVPHHSCFHRCSVHRAGGRPAAPIDRPRHPDSSRIRPLPHGANDSLTMLRRRILRRDCQDIVTTREDPMPSADLVIRGTVLTADEAQPTAEALAVADGRIVAVGDRPGIDSWIGSDTQVVDIGNACVMPGLIEAHGHPLMEAIVLSDRMVDIRPVTMRNANDVVDAIRREVARRGPAGAYLIGWDPLLQGGLPQATREWLGPTGPGPPLVGIPHFGGAGRGRAGASLIGWAPLLQAALPQPTREWLDATAPDTPLVIIHNSG